MITNCSDIELDDKISSIMKKNKSHSGRKNVTKLKDTNFED